MEILDKQKTFDFKDQFSNCDVLEFKKHKFKRNWYWRSTIMYSLHIVRKRDTYYPDLNTTNIANKLINDKRIFQINGNGFDSQDRVIGIMFWQGMRFSKKEMIDFIKTFIFD